MSVRPLRRAASRALLAALCAAPFVAGAQEAPLSSAKAQQIFSSYGCNACHATDEVRIGPPYRAVALRYADASAARADWLAAKIVAGGAGAWGAVPMVSNPRLSTREARALAEWILSLPPEPHTQRVAAPGDGE